MLPNSTATQLESQMPGERLACGEPFMMMVMLLMMMMMPIFMRIEKLHVTCMYAATRLYTIHLYIPDV